MRARAIKLMAGLTAVGALAFGGSALAGAAGKTPPVNPPAPAVDVQQGDQTAPDAAGTAAESSSESAASESASESASSESASASDGPGGHADEPGNANADHQFQGEE